MEVWEIYTGYPTCRSGKENGSLSKVNLSAREDPIPLVVAIPTIETSYPSTSDISVIISYSSAELFEKMKASKLIGDSPS